MPIFFASYFEPQNHHGSKVSISRTAPKGFKVDSKLPIFAPNPALLRDWKKQKVSEAEYTQRYRTHLEQNWPKVASWLDGLSSNDTLTLLCWEQEGEFCHRNLVARVVEKFRFDCFGGCDVPRTELDTCPRCGRSIIPGLDACYCPGCQLWVKPWSLEPFE